MSSNLSPPQVAFVIPVPRMTHRTSERILLAALVAWRGTHVEGVREPPIWACSGHDAQRSYVSTMPGPRPPSADTALVVEWAAGVPPPLAMTAQLTGHTGTVGVGDSSVWYGSDGGYVIAVNGASGSPVWTWQAAPSGWVNAPTFAPDGRHFYVVAAATGVLSAFTAAGTFTWQLKLGVNSTSVPSVIVSRDGTIYVWLPQADWLQSTVQVIHPDKHIVIWSVESGVAPVLHPSGSPMYALTRAGMQVRDTGTFVVVAQCEV